MRDQHRGNENAERYRRDRSRMSKTVSRDENRVETRAFISIVARFLESFRVFKEKATKAGLAARQLTLTCRFGYIPEAVTVTRDASTYSVLVET